MPPRVTLVRQISRFEFVSRIGGGTSVRFGIFYRFRPMNQPARGGPAMAYAGIFNCPCCICSGRPPKSRGASTPAASLAGDSSSPKPARPRPVVREICGGLAASEASDGTLRNACLADRVALDRPRRPAAFIAKCRSGAGPLSPKTRLSHASVILWPRCLIGPSSFQGRRQAPSGTAAQALRGHRRQDSRPARAAKCRCAAARSWDSYDEIRLVRRAERGAVGLCHTIETRRPSDGTGQPVPVRRAPADEVIFFPILAASLSAASNTSTCQRARFLTRMAATP